MMIETAIYEQNPERPEGCQRLVRRRTVGEVYADVRAAFGDYPEGCEEYLTISNGVNPDDEWPEGQIGVYPVTGGSEGHYIHVEVHTGHTADGRTRMNLLVMLGKTFAGWDAAWYFARRLAERLGV